VAANRSVRAAVVASLLLGGVAVAQTSDAPAKTSRGDLPYMRDPDWQRKPTASEMYSAWPMTAKSSGSARINCIVTVVGTLRDCEVVEESPPGSGYGGAALSMAPQFLMKPATSGGKVVEGQVTIPVNFKCGGECPSQHLRPVVRGLLWNTAPTVEDVAEAYPKRALKSGLAGSASLQCEIGVSAVLVHCAVMNEDPIGRGFANAARDLARKFGEPINPPVKGKLTGSMTRLRFSFDPDRVAAPVVVNPTWISSPSEGEWRALALNTSSAVVLRCKVVLNGALSNCQTLSERDAGSASAVLTLIDRFRLATWTEDGQPTVGAVVDLSVIDGDLAPPQPKSP
jgi:TonB family protein